MLNLFELLFIKIVCPGKDFPLFLTITKDKKIISIIEDRDVFILAIGFPVEYTLLTTKYINTNCEVISGSLNVLPEKIFYERIKNEIPEVCMIKDNTMSDKIETINVPIENLLIVSKDQEIKHMMLIE